MKYDYSLKNNISNETINLEELSLLKSPRHKFNICKSITEPAVCNRCCKNQKYRKISESRFNNAERKHRILKLKYLNVFKKNEYMRKKSLDLKKKLTNLRNQNIDNIIDNIENVDENGKTLGKLILSKRGGEYSKAQKTLACTINYKSNSTYTFLRDRLNINLPSKSSISRWTPVKNLCTGFNDAIINILKERIKDCQPREKIVSLIFDAVAIRQELKYNQHYDKIIGFEDYKKNDTDSKIAKELLVFMVRSDFAQWKSIISYFPSKTAVTGESLKNLILENIELLTKIGFKVATIICDQGSGNRSAYNLLKVQKKKPYFFYNDTKIYAIFDVCHLIKSARNSLQKNDMETVDGYASWKNVKEMHNIDRKNATKMCPRLSEKHIYLNNFDKMKVKLATQVLSHSCSAAIKMMNEKNLFSENCKINAIPTSNLLKRMDSIFDCLNSSQEYDNKKKLKSALKLDNNVYNYLKDSIDYLETIKSPTKVSHNYTIICK